MAGRRIRAKTRLQQKIPFGALLFGLRGGTASLPWRMLLVQSWIENSNQRRTNDGHERELQNDATRNSTHDANWSSNALASLRSSVSKPSVNQP